MKCTELNNTGISFPPLISIVTPSYNQGAYIEKTILSVINQTYSNFEYFVIDGGSTDNSVEIIQKYSKNISYWVSEKDGGQSEAINKGFAKAKGDIFLYINSDDLLYPGFLEWVAFMFVKYGSFYDVFYGPVEMIDESDILVRSIVPLPFKLKEYAHGVFSIPQQSCFWKREVFDTVGGFNVNNKTSMDGEFFVMAAIAGFRFTPLQSNKRLTGFRIHNMSITGSGRYNKQFMLDNERIVCMILGGHPNRYLFILVKLAYKLKYVVFKKLMALIYMVVPR